MTIDDRGKERYCLLKVEGNVDKDFAKVLPKHLEEAYQYTVTKMYKEQMMLR